MRRLRFLHAGLLLALVLPVLVGSAAEPARVLYLGDTSQYPFVDAAAKDLGPGVSVRPRASSDPNDTHAALKQLDVLLGEESWDLIYVNYGLGDLFYKDPATREVRAMSKHAGGVRVSTPEQYRANLERLLPRLKATGATVVWAHTTPIMQARRGHSPITNLYDLGSAGPYNRIAAEVMARHQVAVIDLHGYIMKHLGDDPKKHTNLFDYHKSKALQQDAPPHKLVAHWMGRLLSAR